MPLTMNALIKRIRRRLAHDGQFFHVTRGGDANRWYSDLGAFHVVDSSRFVVGRFANVQDLEAFARDLGVIASTETLQESP